MTEIPKWLILPTAKAMTPEQEIALAKLEDRVLTLEIQVRDLQMRAGFELPKVP